jgi:predicted site-specific integrase-resolvase
MGQTIGYARVSTLDQDVSLQLDALRQAGCADDQIFLDVASGTYPTRPGLTACLQALEGVLKIPVDVCKATYTKMSFADFTEIERLSHLVKRARIVRKCSFQEFSNTL